MSETELELGEKQELFAVLLAKQILWITEQSDEAGQKYKVRLGDGCILPRRHALYLDNRVLVIDNQHSLGGCHYMLLAQDFNLFLNGVWLKGGSESIWKLFGEHWKSLHPLCCWGGDFSNVDPNHISLTHNGRK